MPGYSFSRITLLSLLLLSLEVVSLTGQSNYINAGNTALKQGDFEKAEELYEKASSHCGDSNKLKQNAAILLATRGDLEEALKQLDECIRQDSDQSSLYYNRAVIYLQKKDFLNAITDFKRAKHLGQESRSKLERQALSLKKQSEEKHLEALIRLAESETEAGHYEEASQYYDEALDLRPAEPQILFAKANLGLLQKNPFVSLEALEPVKEIGLSEEQKLEVILVKAYSLARINKMQEAVRLLERSLYQNNSTDSRPRELLSYYYLLLSKYDKSINVLRSHNYSNPNTYVVAGNAALRMKNYSLATRYFNKAKSLDPDNLHAAIGTAMCLSQQFKNSSALQLIDSLSVIHPDNHDVWNIKGIIHKDVGLYYKNNFREQRANAFFVTSAAAFLTAQEINKHMKAVYDSNRALALFFQNKKQAAKNIWSENREMASQNNLALFYASQNDYRTAYAKLDSLYGDYMAKYKKKNSIVDYNRGLARSRTRLNNNYKFLTNFTLHQDKPQLTVDNPFTMEPEQTLEASNHFEFSLAYSDENCREKLKRKKSKKKKRIRFIKRKKKKYSGECPKF